MGRDLRLGSFSWLVAVAASCSIGLASSRAFAHDAGLNGAEAASSSNATSGTSGAGSEVTSKLPFRGSVLLFDQSATTTTVGLGQDYQSADPVYEWWLAFKPRYVFYETHADSLSASLWANVYLELTNSDTTTLKREPLIGPTYLWATYAHVLHEVGGYKTQVSVGPRAAIPTDKAGRGSGQIVSLGATAGLSQTLALAGKDAIAFSSATIRVGLTYMHPFNRAVTPTNEDIDQLRQDNEGRTIHDDQLRAGENVRNSLAVAFSGDLQILPKLSFSLSYVMQNAWVYSPMRDATIYTTTGPIVASGVDSPTTHRVSPWFTASLDYDAFDEMSIGVGYYNLATQTGPDGVYRSPFWSPSARVFLTLTGKLDAIYERFAQKPRRAEVASGRP